MVKNLYALSLDSDEGIRMEVADMMLLIVKEFISDEDTLIYSK
jgi:hypothetical protein